MKLLTYNRHWQNAYVYPFGLERNQLRLLISHASKKQICELTGLRRTGKTTMLLQTINHLIRRKVNPHAIWYFTFDDEKTDIDKLLAEFVKQSGKDFRKQKIYVFLDEIQKLKDFQKQLKVFYDLYPEIKFYISGSTSLFIKQKTQESLAGRVFSILLPPLDFKEYLRFTSKEHFIKNPQMYSMEIETEYEYWWGHQFIETLFIKNENNCKEYLISILKKVIFEDIPQVFPVENPAVLFAIIKIIAQNPGMYLHYENLGNDLQISSKTVSKYISVLEQSFLIRVLYNFSKNQLSSEKKMKRVYLASPSFCIALSDYVQKGGLAENAVLSVKNYEFFWQDPFKHEVDFIDTSTKSIMPIEVKYSHNLRRNDLQNVFLFQSKFESKEVILLMKRPDDVPYNYKGMDVTLQSIFWF